MRLILETLRYVQILLQIQEEMEVSATLDQPHCLHLESTSVTNK